MNNRIVFGTFSIERQTRYHSKFASWIWLQDNIICVGSFRSKPPAIKKPPPVRRDVKSCSTFFHRDSDADSSTRSTRRRHTLYVSSKNPPGHIWNPYPGNCFRSRTDCPSKSQYLLSGVLQYCQPVGLYLRPSVNM